MVDLCRLEMLLHVMHHRHGGNKNYGRNYLMRVQTGMEDAPGDANRGQCLHHLEVAGCGCAREMQPLKINQERNAA